MQAGFVSAPDLGTEWGEGASARARWALPLLLAAALGFGLAFFISVDPLKGLAVPAAVAALVLFTRRPHWLLAAFVTSLAVPIQLAVAGLPVNAADALLLLWCGLWPLMMMRAEAPAIAQWRPPTLVWLIAPFILAVGLAQIGSIHPEASLKQLLRVIEWFVLLPLVLTALRPDARFQRFAGAALMTLPCLFAIDGVYEYLRAGERLTGLLGIPVPIPEGGDDQIRHTFDISGRAGSTFGGAQGLAIYLVMTMAFSVAHILHPPAPWMRRLGWCCLAMAIGGLYVAQSRGGVLGGVAVVVAVALTLRPSLRRALPLGLLFLTCVSLVGMGLWADWDGSVAGLVPGRPDSVLDRLIIWSRAWSLMLENPFLGVGLGNFRDHFFEREAWLHVDLAYPSLHAHNTYLELLAGTGWLGLIAYLGFLAAVARRLTRLWDQPGPKPVLTLGAIGALAAYAVFAMVDMLLLQNMHLLLILLLSLGLTAPGSPMVGVPLAERPFTEPGH